MKTYFIPLEKNYSEKTSSKLLQRVGSHYEDVQMMLLTDPNKPRFLDDFPNRLKDIDFGGEEKDNLIILENGFQLAKKSKNHLDHIEKYTSVCIDALKNHKIISLFKFPFVSIDNILKEYLYLQKNLNIDDISGLFYHIDKLDDRDYEYLEEMVKFRMTMFYDFLQNNKTEKQKSLRESQLGHRTFADGETSTSLTVKPQILKLSKDFVGNLQDKDIYSGENAIVGRKAYYKYKSDLKNAILDIIRNNYEEFDGKNSFQGTYKEIQLPILNLYSPYEIISEQNYEMLITEERIRRKALGNEEDGN